jgi:hypothetical protein
MRNAECKKTAKAVPHGDTALPPSIKPILVRKLTTLEDVRRIQARLVKEYLAGRISTETAKTGAYLTSTLVQTLRELKPSTDHPPVTELIIGFASEEEEAFITRMNNNIMDPPDDNGANN